MMQRAEMRKFALLFARAQRCQPLVELKSKIQMSVQNVKTPSVGEARKIHNLIPEPQLAFLRPASVPVAAGPK